MTEWTVEEIDPEIWLTREVYANYGLAMYMAQVLENGLVNVAIWTGIRDRVYSTHEDAEADMLALFRQTMGAQRVALLNRRPDLVHMEDLLTRAVKLRNFLAHSYFGVRAAAFATEDGQHRMIEELKRARLLRRSQRTAQDSRDGDPEAHRQREAHARRHGAGSSGRIRRAAAGALVVDRQSVPAGLGSRRKPNAEHPGGLVVALADAEPW